MKTCRQFTLVVCMLPIWQLTALVTSAFSAQSAAPGLAGAEKDDVITLSPFNVSPERDPGFVAASALAGGRLAGDLKDTAIAYSVITREVIEDLGITNGFEAASWSPNTVIRKAATGGGYGDDVSNSPQAYSVGGGDGGRGHPAEVGTLTSR